MSNPLSKICTTSSIAVLLAMVSPTACAADDNGSSMFSFGGFGTLGLVHSSEHQADFTGSVFGPTGAGFSHDWSSDVDSQIAGQVTANFTSKLSAVVQVIAQQNYDDTYRPHVEWADIKYQFTPEFNLRVGRTVLPSFLVSDARNVGFANPWVRPPVEVYGLIPVTNSDGVDASYTLHIGAVVQTFTGSYGETDPNIPMRGTAEAKREWVIADTIEYGATTLHLAYEETHLTVDYVGTLFDAFRQFGPQGNAIANQYDQENKRLKFLGLGAMYDPGRWFVMGEWGTVDFNSVFGRNTAWYVTSGYRIAKFTPYLTYAQAKSNNLSDPGLTISALPPSLAGPAMGLNAGLNSILSAKVVQSTVSAGARWDFVKNFDLKLQFDHTRIGAGSSGELTNLQPAFQLGSKVDLITVTVDFVF